MKFVKINNIKVFYMPEHDGGGIKFYKEFQKILKNKKIKSVLEFCSGPGFIGFSLLKIKSVKNVTLIDINKKLKKGIERTIKINKLEDKCNFYFGNGLKALKSKKIKFDCIVSNPPHIDLKKIKYNLPINDRKIIYDDTDFKIHKDFFKNAHKFLNDKGVILFIENALQSDFNDIVNKKKYPKLKFLRSPKTELPNKYYIYATKKN